MGAIQAIPQTQSRQLQRRQTRQVGRVTTRDRAALVRSVGMTKYLLKIKLRLREKAAWRTRVSTIKQMQALENHIALQQAEPSSSDAKKTMIQSKDVKGLKFLDLVAPLLERLHSDGCTRDTAGNRKLHYDQHCMLVLLYLFNPAITSLRALDQASTLDKVKKRLGCSRATASSMSEAAGIFDADRLKAIIAELGTQTHKIKQHQSLQEIDKTITLVDGSLVSAMPSILAASFFKEDNATKLVKWRLHTHFEVDRGLPVRIGCNRRSAA